jgi:hypothetical protein
MDSVGLLRKRAEDLTGWIRENAPECGVEQKHLDADTPEQIYWHYGYLCAVRDAVELLNRSCGSVDTSSLN